DHLYRVRWFAQTLAEQLAVAGPYQAQMDSSFLHALFRASPLHDIGKVTLNDALLFKSVSLTCHELDAMRRHTVIGGELLLDATKKLPNASYLGIAAEIARSHHERFDGAGYPDGLAGEQIPLPARIFALADAFDTLTSADDSLFAISFSEAVRGIVME